LLLLGESQLARSKIDHRDQFLLVLVEELRRCFLEHATALAQGSIQIRRMLDSYS
jgi:hypothetical protein